jgi:hypothetical protein
MPRGRKGSPQESVDSILLALSRREDIEPETMSHYMDRLDEEWSEGAREKVLHLLRSNDSMAQAAAIRILTELATDFDLEGLEDFVADPTIGDMAKLSLSPVLKELGSEMADDGIIEYLNDPPGAIRQMQLRLLELVEHSEMGIETILEDVVSMPVERRLAFVSWLGNSNDPRAASLLIPLLENQTGKVATAVVDALEQLGPIAINQTIPALKYFTTISSNRELKQYSRTALGRLTMQSMLGTEDAAMLEARQQQLPVHEARVSTIDGSGTQLIMLSWQRSDGLIKGINVLSHEQKGIKDCYGVDEMDVERWNALVGDLNEQGFSSFVVPFEYARLLVTEARALNRRSRHKLPIAYSIWRPLIEGMHPENGSSGKKRVQPSFPTALEPLVADSELITRSQHGDELYQLSEFMSWLYEPVERIEPYITRFWATQQDFEFHPRSRRSKPKSPERQGQLTEIVDDAVDVLIDDKWRQQYEARLRRQAALFQLAGREKDVTLIRAVASVLHPSSGVPLREQAFPRALVRVSIEQGPLRLMVESLRSGNLSSFPIEFLNQE